MYGMCSENEVALCVQLFPGDTVKWKNQGEEQLCIVWSHFCKPNKPVDY